MVKRYSRITIIVDSKLFAYVQHQRYKPIVGLIDEVGKYIDIAIDKLNLSRDEVMEKQVVWAMDTGKPLRADILKVYKQNRKEKKTKLDRFEIERLEQFQELYPKLSSVFDKLGTSVAIDRVEADDVASVIAYNKAPEDLVIMISSDRDWTKFLKDDNTYIINPSKKGLMYNRTGVASVMEWTPIQKVMIDTFCGVTKEDIPGIDFLGVKTFNKLVWAKLPKALQTLEDYLTLTKACAKLIEDNGVLSPRMLKSDALVGTTVEAMAIKNLKLTVPIRSVKELVEWGVTASTDRLVEALKYTPKFRTVTFKEVAQALNKIGQPVGVPEASSLRAFNILI